ncbi:hypothetical protein GWO68_07910 [Pontibacter sp. BT213]|uniref:Uncharacterized protein n=2 Tax=Pontibacter fetidus TaxID=2700082 RepID=A0A6B2H674_9BACT|nr:hypothetical protein [Pontibacter fetidus]
MGLKDLLKKVKKEADALKGDAAKDKLYSNDNTYPDAALAREAFEQAKAKLFDVNRWSALPGINSTFALYDATGNQLNKAVDAPGYYIKIELPGPTPENWVQVTDVQVQENLAEFTVRPSEKPQPEPAAENVTEHFFTKDASSTFRVELNGNTLVANEIGKNEVINNQGEEAGNRAVANTLIAEGGWAGFQGLQWNKLTAYLVHKEDAQK